MREDAAEEGVLKCRTVLPAKCGDDELRSMYGEAFRVVMGAVRHRHPHLDRPFATGKTALASRAPREHHSRQE